MHPPAEVSAARVRASSSPVKDSLRAARLLAAIAIAASVLAAPATPNSGSASPATPNAVVRLEDSYLRGGKYRQLYGLFTARFRAHCGYTKFRRKAQSSRPTLRKLRLVLVAVRIRGAKAYVNYRYVQGRRWAFTVKNDLYVKAAGRWYDELDPTTRC